MKVAKHSNPSRHTRNGASIPTLGAGNSSRAAESLPTLMACAFDNLDVKRRSSLLGRLLGSSVPWRSPWLAAVYSSNISQMPDGPLCPYQSRMLPSPHRAKCTNWSAMWSKAIRTSSKVC